MGRRLPERGLLDILARTAHLLGWSQHFGPASGSDPKIRDAMARYVPTVFANGTLLGPAQVARHMREQVSAHELSIAANKHTTSAKIDAHRDLDQRGPPVVYPADVDRPCAHTDSRPGGMPPFRANAGSRRLREIQGQALPRGAARRPR